MLIKGGPSQILRTVTNLVSNAVDAMYDIGQLTIRTENCYVDAVTGEQGRVPTGEYVKLTVADTGGGIPKDHVTEIFEPFFTTKTTDRKRGSGLGLSVVHAVVEDHNGYIDFTSEEGRGTSFFVYFPVTREHEVSFTTDQQVIGGAEKILVIDDAAMQLEVVTTLLAKLGYQANTAKGGEEAIEVAKETSPDLLIVDMIMPDGIDGAETYRRILESNPHQKAIIVSGFAESARVQEAIRLGAGAFVRKPLTFMSIARAVRTELDRVIPHK